VFLIINCPTCGKIIMANAANQSRTCPNCGVKISINRAKVLAKSKTSQRALELIQNIKQRENKDSYQVTYKKFKA
jgi:predicted RNA-binding Zn-ribbon protein involved in translation (DUF1610 family)